MPYDTTHSATPALPPWLNFPAADPAPADPLPAAPPPAGPPPSGPPPADPPPIGPPLLDSAPGMPVIAEPHTSAHPGTVPPPAAAAPVHPLPPPPVGDGPATGSRHAAVPLPGPPIGAPPPAVAPAPPPPFPGYPPAPEPSAARGSLRPGPGLDEVAVRRRTRRSPSRGWRRAVHTLSAGTINPGEAPADLRHQQLLDRLRRPVRGDYRIAVLSLKGGVGKTTTTVGLGSTFASLRGDRVIAVDANPDLGTLAQRIPQQTTSTVRDLLADGNVYRYSDVRAHTSQAPSRLEVLASERDPAVAEAFSEEEYRGVCTILQKFYNLIITDCGTGLSHSAMRGVLDLANAIILVSSPALDGARSASATLDWLTAHGFGHLVSRAVVVLSASRPGASTIDLDQLAAHFLTRCRAVASIPFDDHLAEGADIDLELVGKPARMAFVELAAIMADGFAAPAPRTEQPFLG
ncbi:MAG: MinD/ParA family protein [Gordonia sp. (in: high G+C Gram-positive bacteria)]